MAVRNVKLTVLYDGSSYHGWQIQPDHNTVQQELTQAIESLMGKHIQITGASRTDAGVSALGQAAAFKIDSPIPTKNMAKAITDRLPEDIAVTEAIEVEENFDVIRAVKNKLYRYTIFTDKVRPVLQIKHCWHYPYALDIAAMAEAAKLLEGKKDFKSFASAADKRESSIRTIFNCDVNRDKNYVYVNVEGDGFLYNMVRNIVGTLVEVGVGRMEPQKIEQILNAQNRSTAGPIAPAAGLCLMWIKY